MYYQIENNVLYLQIFDFTNTDNMRFVSPFYVLAFLLHSTFLKIIGVFIQIICFVAISSSGIIITRHRIQGGTNDLSQYNTSILCI
jgi:hypothetical protein